MALLRNLVSRRFHSLLNPRRPLSPPYTTHPNTPHSLKIPPFHHRPITSSPQIQHPVDSEPETKQNKRPLHAFFMEAVGLSERTGISESETDGETEKELKNKLRQLEGEVRGFKGKSDVERVPKKGKLKKSEPRNLTAENSELKRNLGQLEGEVRSLKEKAEGDTKKEKLKKAERRSLHAVFTNQPASVSTRKEVKLREPVVIKELSPDMEIFVQHLYKSGYFKDANFAKDKRFDLSWFESFFARGYITFAAQKFARDNQEIAKWLSGSALKQVAIFGCPSVDRGCVFPAKRLRNFFEIPENTVCSKCTLRQSCKFVNQSVWKGNTNNLDLAVVMKVLISYALESVHPQLVVPDQVNKSVSQLLKELLKLSETS